MIATLVQPLVIYSEMANVPFRQASAQDRRFRLDSLRDRLLPAASLSISNRSSTEKAAVLALIKSDKTWLLLPFAFIGILASYTNSSPGTVFILNFLGMIPLARLLGDATEELAAGLRNETAGALLNATFGNAVEMIITYQTISAGLVTVTKSSLLGSILSNLLLVLGSSFFFGGIGRIGKQQEFRESGPLVSMSMLLLTCIGFAVPTVVENTKHVDVMGLSRVSAIGILLSYIALLVYQLYTHRTEFESPLVEEEENEEGGATMSVKTSSVICLFPHC